LKTTLMKLWGIKKLEREISRLVIRVGGIATRSIKNGRLSQVS